MFDEFFKDYFRKRNFACAFCEQDLFLGEDTVCDECREELAPVKEFCFVCGKTMPASGVCGFCTALGNRRAITKGRARTEYGEVASLLVIKFKGGQRLLAEFFARQMYETYVSEFADKKIDFITFVPSGKEKMKRRMFNPARILAEELGKLASLPVINAVEKLYENDEQKRLGALDRLANVKGCFAARKELCEGKRILLVDDVMTTGATSEAVARALKRAGAAWVFFIAYATVGLGRKNASAEDKRES